MCEDSAATSYIALLGTRPYLPVPLLSGIRIGVCTAVHYSMHSMRQVLREMIDPTPQKHVLRYILRVPVAPRLPRAAKSSMRGPERTSSRNGRKQPGLGSSRRNELKSCENGDVGNAAIESR